MNEPLPRPICVSGNGRVIAAQPAALNGLSKIGQETRHVWTILCIGVSKFSLVAGAQWAGAFTFNAFFSLFPLILLLVTVASFFVDRDRAGKAVIAHVESYVPISCQLQHQVFAPSPV